MFSLKSLFLLILLTTHLTLPHAHPSLSLPKRSDGDFPIYDGSAGSNPNPNNRHFRYYTALGDRVAAGASQDRLHFENDTALECRRSLHAYPYSFLSEFGPSLGLTNFNFPACATTTSSADVYQQLMSGVSLSPLPRIWYNFGQPDLVTISLGAAEEELYPGIRANCVDNLGRLKPNDVEYQEHCWAAMRRAWQRVNKERKNYEDLFQWVRKHDLAPNQKREVYILGLPKPFSLTEFWCPVNRFLPPYELLKEWNNIVGAWNDMLREEADNAGITYVDVDKKFDWHRVCDKRPWFYIDATEDFLYPTAKGQGVLRDAVAEAALQMVIKRPKEEKLGKDNSQLCQHAPMYGRSERCDGRLVDSSGVWAVGQY